MRTRKDTKETLDALCVLDQQAIKITHRRIEVPGRQSDPSFLRVDSWDCSKAKGCKKDDCLAKTRSGIAKYWQQDT